MKIKSALYFFSMDSTFSFLLKLPALDYSLTNNC